MMMVDEEHIYSDSDIDHAFQIQISNIPAKSYIYLKRSFFIYANSSFIHSFIHPTHPIDSIIRHKHAMKRDIGNSNKILETEHGYCCC